MNIVCVELICSVQKIAKFQEKNVKRFLIIMVQDTQKECTTNSEDLIQKNSFSLKFSFFKDILNKTDHICEIEKRVEGCVLRCKYKCSACKLEKYCRSLFGEFVPSLLEPDTQQLKKDFPELFI